MCIPPVDAVAAPHFALLAKIAKRLGLPSLSMGMSGDFETAIAMGATDVQGGERDIRGAGARAVGPWWFSRHKRAWVPVPREGFERFEGNRYRISISVCGPRCGRSRRIVSGLTATQPSVGAKSSRAMWRKMALPAPRFGGARL